MTFQVINCKKPCQREHVNKFLLQFLDAKRPVNNFGPALFSFSQTNFEHSLDSFIIDHNSKEN